MSETGRDADRDVGLSTVVDPARRAAAGAVLQDHYDMDVPWHHHDMHQLQYAFEGAMELEDEQRRHLLPRSLAGWIPAGTRHRTSLHRIRSISIMLSPGSVSDAGSSIRILRVSPLMRAMIAEAARWPLDRQPGTTDSAYFTAFAYLCGEWIGDEAPLTLPTTSDAALDRALAHVRANPATSRMDSAACAAGLSERSLRRRCHAELGMGWNHYRRHARLLAAVEPLTETDQSIARIAGDVGFESQSAFARAFRNYVGQTPQEFRRRSRQRG